MCIILSFPFKPNKILLMLHLIHIKCLNCNIPNLILSNKMVVNFIFNY